MRNKIVGVLVGVVATAVMLAGCGTDTGYHDTSYVTVYQPAYYDSAHHYHSGHNVTVTKTYYVSHKSLYGTSKPHYTVKHVPVLRPVVKPKTGTVRKYKSSSGKSFTTTRRRR